MNTFLEASQNSFSALEQIVWESLLVEHQEKLSNLLWELDLRLKEERDKSRYELKDIKEREIVTRVGPTKIRRSYYYDKENNEWVYLLDEHLGLKARARVSDLVREDAVVAAVSGKSYRGASEEIERQNTGATASHEAIRQWTMKTGEVLEQEGRLEAQHLDGKKQVPILFIETDGFWVSMQKEKKQELRFAVVHEGWQPRGSKGHALVNRQEIFPPKGEDFWEYVSAIVESRYDLTGSHVVINGDRAPWIGKGTEWFPNSLYQIDRFHLLREIRQTLRSQPELLQAAQNAVYDDTPQMLLDALLQALPKATENQKKQIRGLCAVITKQPETVRDYRTRLKEKNIDVEGYLGLGAAEPTVARFSGRLRRLGRSWSSRGALAMAHAIAGQGQGILRRAVLTMEQQSGLEKLVKRIKQPTKTISEACVFDRSIPILDTGRTASGGLSHALRRITGGTMHPRFI